jgi:7-cyano-7-deazaguanine synthase
MIGGALRMDRAVVLLSGGINSTVAAAIVREQCELALLHVAWGHRTAERELTAFQDIAEILKAEQNFVAELSCMAMIGGNARASRRMAIEDANVVGRGIPTTFAFGLLPTMMSMAVAWAASIRARRIVVGISEDHGTGPTPIGKLYPDRRRDFVQAFNLMLQYAKPTDRDLIVEAPFIDLTRAEVVKLGQRLKVPFESTWSCYSSNKTPCHRCIACTTRQMGFLQAGVPDPLVLEPSRM